MRKTFTAKSFTGGGEEGKERISGQNQTAPGLLAPRVARVSDEANGDSRATLDCIGCS